MEYSDASSSELTQNPRTRLRLSFWTWVGVGISMVSNVGVEGEGGAEDSLAVLPIISKVSKTTHMAYKNGNPRVIVRFHRHRLMSTSMSTMQVAEVVPRDMQHFVVFDECSDLASRQK